MIAVVAVAGGVGAACRFLVDGYVSSKARTSLPTGTFLINVTGAFLLAVLTGAVSDHYAPEGLQQILGTGLLGGYTTFSTASVATVRLIQIRRYGAAVLSSLGMLVLALGAVLAGLRLAHAF